MKHINTHKDKRAYRFTSHGLCMRPAQCVYMIDVEFEKRTLPTYRTHTKARVEVAIARADGLNMRHALECGTGAHTGGKRESGPLKRCTNI